MTDSKSKQVWSYCYSWGSQSVDTQKLHISLTLTSLPQPNKCNSKIVSSVNPGQIQKDISDCEHQR
jgi:hypothetical protein